VGNIVFTLIWHQVFLEGPRNADFAKLSSWKSWCYNPPWVVLRLGPGRIAYIVAGVVLLGPDRTWVFCGGTGKRRS